MVVRATIQCVQMVSQLEHLFLLCGSPRITPCQRHGNRREKRLQLRHSYGTIRPPRREGFACPPAVGATRAPPITRMPCVQVRLV